MQDTSLIFSNTSYELPQLSATSRVESSTSECVFYDEVLSTTDSNFILTNLPSIYGGYTGWKSITHGSYKVPQEYEVSSAERESIDDFLSIKPVVGKFLDNFRPEVHKLFGNEVKTINLALFVDYENLSEELIIKVDFGDVERDFEELFAKENLLFETVAGAEWFDSALEFVIIEYV